MKLRLTERVRLVLDRLRRPEYRPIRISLHFQLQADGTIYQCWPGENRPLRRVGEPAVMALVHAEYERLRRSFGAGS